MTAKEKILTLLENINYYYNDCTMYDTIKNLLEEMIEEMLEMQKWIPCSEKIPDNNVEVLVFTYEGVVDLADRHIGGTWQTRDSFLYDDEEILAWLPLPEPYEKEKPDE